MTKHAGLLIWLICVGGCALMFTAIGIYAFRRKEPMWFWSGSTVRREEISNVEAYNRANGVMWVVYSIPYWASTVLFAWYPEAATTLLVLAATVGLLPLIFVYHKIYEKYRKYK